jgi:hypothetical protein
MTLKVRSSEDWLRYLVGKPFSFEKEKRLSEKENRFKRLHSSPYVSSKQPFFPKQEEGFVACQGKEPSFPLGKGHHLLLANEGNLFFGVNHRPFFF